MVSLQLVSTSICEGFQWAGDGLSSIGEALQLVRADDGLSSIGERCNL